MEMGVPGLCAPASPGSAGAHNYFLGTMLPIFGHQCLPCPKRVPIWAPQCPVCDCGYGRYLGKVMDYRGPSIEVDYHNARFG